MRPKHSRKHFIKNDTTFYCLLEAARSFQPLVNFASIRHFISVLGPFRDSFHFENKRLFLLVPSPFKVKLAVYFQIYYYTVFVTLFPSFCFALF